MDGIRPAGHAHTPADQSDRLREHAKSTAETKLRKAAQQLEATFLAEMLKHSGAGKSRETFGGGVGEDQFASFLRQAQAEEMAKSGGIGLAEHLFEALKENENGIL